ncbi:cysteine synthase [Betaproteobacteria bacterium]|nr:cysteine synthase [Betaproteobacteria bacterium]GHT98575.1 cysteine synthase [Betaproteobacteria bacterium]GHU21891.1 cysteine synthase [Betaproteobacteria bacterium]GHU27294.1 cysteine synthase [Betaproteobacteria bacterium]
MSGIANSALELIGKTPVIRLNRIADKGAAIYLKLENFNVGGSVKDRIALNMIEQAEAEGRIRPGDTLIENTSGNTGIGLALVAAIKGYKLVITMSEAVSVERRKLMQAYGAEVVLTPAAGGIQAGFAKTAELIEQYGYFELRQFYNEHNPETHYQSTGPEIAAAFGGNLPDFFVSGVGTGGTITGAGRYLRERKPEVKIIAVEPDDSAVLSGGAPGPHAIQGIGAGIIPAVLDTTIYDRIIRVTNDEAQTTSRLLARREGLLLGYSAGAAVFAALRIAQEVDEDKHILAIAPDTGERYLSTPLYDVSQ